MCDVGEVRAEAKAAAAALTSDGLRGAVRSSGRTDVGLVRTEGGRLTGVKAEVEPWATLEAKAGAGGLTLGALVFLRVSLPPRVRWVCSWSKAKSSRRWVRANFCWMAIRRREFRVFFSSSAAASCLCISSSWVTYSSHLKRASYCGNDHMKCEETIKFKVNRLTFWKNVFIKSLSY